MNIFAASARAIVTAFNAIAYICKACETLARSTDKACQVLEANADLLLDEAKELNKMRRQDIDVKIETRYAEEKAGWDNI